MNEAEIDQALAAAEQTLRNAQSGAMPQQPSLQQPAPAQLDPRLIQQMVDAAVRQALAGVNVIPGPSGADGMTPTHEHVSDIVHEVVAKTPLPKGDKGDPGERGPRGPRGEIVRTLERITDPRRMGESDGSSLVGFLQSGTELVACTDGMIVEGLNSLGIAIQSLNASSCTRALRLVGQGDDQRNSNTVHVGRASLSSNTTDFQMDKPGNLTVVSAFSEGSVAGHKFLSTGSAAVGTTQVSPTMVTLINCYDNNSSGADQLLHLPGTYTVINGKYEQGFSCGGQTGAQLNKSSLNIDGAIIADATPVARVGGITDIWRVRRRATPANNVNAAGVWDDEEFIWDTAGTKSVLWSYDWTNLKTYLGFASGTFTPAVTGSSTAGAQTYSIQSGRYTQIGRVVFYEIMIRMTAKDGTTAGNISITGLPFTSASGTPRGNVAVGMVANIDLNVAGGYYQVIGEIVGAGTKIDLYAIGDNG
jgi:hypothetical protein